MLHSKRRIRPAPLARGSNEVVDLIENYFNAYNAARLRESCQVFARMIDSGATIGVSIAGALTPAGLSSVLVPLMQAGFIDYLSSTGANLYHDLHFDLDLPLYRGNPEGVSGSTLHNLIGKYALETSKATGAPKPSLLGAAYELDLPIWVASPGDSTIGLNLSAIRTAEPERGPHLDPA